MKTGGAYIPMLSASSIRKGMELRAMMIEYDGKTLWWNGEIGVCED